MKKNILSAMVASSILISAVPAVPVCAAAPVYAVGICQLQESEMPDDLTRGFEAALIDVLGFESLIFDEQNAEGNPDNYSSLINSFIAENDNLIFAPTADALSAAVAATDTLPVVSTALAETQSIPENVTGIFSVPSADDQASMIQALVEPSSAIGIVYQEELESSCEQASNLGLSLAYLEIATEEFPYSDSPREAFKQAAETCSAIYIPVNDPFAADADALLELTRETGLPIIACSRDACSKYALAVLAPSDYDIGYAAGLAAAQILSGTAVSELRPAYADVFRKYYNEALSQELNFPVSNNFESLGTTEITEETMEDLLAMEEKETEEYLTDEETASPEN